MKTDKNMNTARKLSLEEIEAMPRGSVVWRSFYTKTDEGIIWHTADPMLVCLPGHGGYLLGADKDSYWEGDIDNSLMSAPDISYWNSEPADDQLRGITKEQYNAMTNEELIVNTKLAAAITTRGVLFKELCSMTGMNFNHFWKALTGECEFVRSEIVTIRTVLDLTDDEVLDIFFPEVTLQI